MKLFRFLTLLGLLILAQAKECKHIEIIGINGHALDNAKMSIRALDYLLCDAMASVPTTQKLAHQAITEALKPFGYFHPILTWQQDSTNHWQVTIHPGPLTTIKNVTMVIQTKAPGLDVDHLLTSLTVQTLTPLNAEYYQDDLIKLVNIANQQGYLFAKSNKSHLVIDANRNNATAHFHLDPGPRFYVGAMNIHAKPFDEAFILNYLLTRPGQSFDPLRLEKDEERLNESGYFKSVSFIRHPAIKDHQIPLTLTLTPKEKRYYLLGMGYDTDLGIQGIAGVKSRYLNGRGHQLKITGRLGNYRSQIDGQYIIPMRDPTHDKMTLQATLETDLNKDFGRSEYVDLSTHFWHQTPYHNFHAGLILKREHSYPNDAYGYHSKLIYPELEWRVHFKEPHQTFIFRTKVKGAHRHFFSDVSFTQWQSQGTLRLGDDQPWQLNLHGTLGFTHIRTLDDLPLSLQFATGGAQTIRGFAYQSIGPGRVLKIGSLAFNRMIEPHIYGTVFVDAGNASEHLTDAWRKAAGVGILWALPLGQCIFSIARPIHETDHHWRLHLSFSL